MKLKSVYATAHLGWFFSLRILKRIFFIRSNGLKEFRQFYREDRLATLSLEEKRLLEDSSRCVHCGLCDSLCPAIVRTTQETFLGPSFLSPLSRSIPSFAGVVPLKFDECMGCRGCETVCPERVPLRGILQFMKDKSAMYE